MRNLISQTMWLVLVGVSLFIINDVRAQSIFRSTADIVRQTSEIGIRSTRPLDARAFNNVNLAPLRRAPTINEADLIRFLRQADADLASAVDNLEPAARRATLEALAGARAIERALPNNPVRRAEIVERGGVDLLRATAHPVEGLGDALLLVDGSVRAGRLPDASISQFARALDRHGESFNKVWNDYIAPNWDRLLAGGLIIGFLSNPELFIDAAGNLTRHAVSAFSELGVEIITSSIEGVGQGVSNNIARRIGDGSWWVYAVILGIAASLFWYRVRGRRQGRRR